MLFFVMWASQISFLFQCRCIVLAETYIKKYLFILVSFYIHQWVFISREVLSLHTVGCLLRMLQWGCEMFFGPLPSMHTRTHSHFLIPGWARLQTCHHLKYLAVHRTTSLYTSNSFTSCSSLTYWLQLGWLIPRVFTRTWNVQDLFSYSCDILMYPIVL